jgi:hypothetical protein
VFNWLSRKQAAKFLNPRIHTGAVSLPAKLARIAEGLKAFMAGTAALCASEYIGKCLPHGSQLNGPKPAPVRDGESRFRASDELRALVPYAFINLFVTPREKLKRNQKTHPLRLPVEEEILMRITR